MDKVLVLYNWRVFDPVRERFYVTRYKATVDEMRTRHPEATLIESSREDRQLSDDPFAFNTSAFMRSTK